MFTSQSFDPSTSSGLRIGAEIFLKRKIHKSHPIDKKRYKIQ